MAGKSEKNMHLEHLEDDIINLGYKGAQQSIAFVEALLQLFEGNSAKSVNITVKWDGAPAVVAGQDPETGLFFVATKHGAFAKDMKLGFSEEHIDLYYQGGLADTLKYVYRELKDLGMKDVLQGDVMFTHASKKKQTIDGVEYITFKPNTIMYAIPVADPLAQSIEKANVGIVFHTKYSGKGQVNSMSSSFSVDVSKLKSPTAWIQDATYRDVSGKMTLTNQETRTVSSNLASAKTNALTAKKFLDELSNMESDLSVGYLFKIFVNRLVREGKPITQRSLAGLKSFIVERISAKEAGVKTASAKARYSGILKETEAYLQKNNTNLRAMFSLYENLLIIKNILVKKLNGAQSIPTFIETPEGFKVTDPEGYVAVDKKGNAVKLVNRMEFSQANFNAVKDWAKPAAAPTDVDKQLKTIVFAFGRLNPPTIGHKKLIDKVISLAKSNKGDHLVVMSKSQDAKKNPLSPEDKLKFAKLMFPNTNLDVATLLMPTFIGWLKEFSNKQYDKVIMVAGSDRVDEYQALINKYNGKDFKFKIAEVISAGERDPDADGAAGMSASKMREFAMKDDFNNFKKGLPSTMREKDMRALMKAVQEGMQ
jgi:hypothetical protein